MTKKLNTTKSSKTSTKKKDLRAKAAAKASEAAQTFSILAKRSVFSKCKKANLQRVLEEYV